MPQWANSLGEMFLSRMSSGLFMVACLSVARAARVTDLDALDALLRSATREIDVQQPVLEPRADDLDAVGKHERPLELACGDAAVEVDALLVVDLLAANDELVVLDLDRKLVHAETGDGQRDAQLILATLFDVVRRIAVGGRLADPVERPLELLESQQQGRIEHRQASHLDLLDRAKSCLRAPYRAPDPIPAGRAAYRPRPTPQIWEGGRAGSRAAGGASGGFWAVSRLNPPPRRRQVQS